jgi:sugar lactone lactonase YvrE
MRMRLAAATVCACLLAACAAPSPSPGESTAQTAAGSANASASAGPSLPATSSWEPTGLGFDDSGNLLVTDCIAGYLYRVDSSGSALRIAGTGVSTPAGGLSGEGVLATSADLHCPADATGDGHGNILVVDHANNRIRRIDGSGLINTIIGAGPIGTGTDDGDLAGDGGPASAAILQEPWEIAFGPDGVLFIADRDNHAIRTVDAAGIIATIAGSGDRGFSGDGGLAIEADLSRPQGVAVDALGNVYFADSDNHVIRRVDGTGVITTVAGTDVASYSGNDPNGVAFDADGNLYFVDDLANVVRRIGSDGVITTAAGTGAPGFSGDGGQATAATLNTPGDIAFDAVGNLYIADALNHRIRVVHPDGTIHTFATGLP